VTTTTRSRATLVRSLAGPVEAAAAADLLTSIWSQSDGLSAEAIRGFEHAGNCVIGAFERNRLVGVVIGIFSLDERRCLELHSHVLGVAPESRGHNLGFLLKQHQREWARERGIRRITWTTDPLVRTNAHFNLVKLGARVVAYEEGFYGARPDAINAGDETDRIVVEWDVDGPVVQGAASTAPARAVALLEETAEGEPRIGRRAETGSEEHLLHVPADIVAMRRSDPGRARRWRLALRRAMLDELAAGRRVTGFASEGCYLTEAAR
jgi:predicted GNAT superfamily acetyltransferase